MKRTALGCVVLCLCLVCCPASSQERFKGKGKLKGKGQPPTTEAYSGARWEYSVRARSQVARLGDDLQAGLDKLGDDGWELVAVEPPAGPGHLYFKRPKRGAGTPAGSSSAAEAKEVTRVLRLKHANAAEMAQTLAQLYRERERGVRMAVDGRTNSIVLVGPDERLLDVVKLAAELDGPDEGRPEGKRKEEKPGGR